METQKHEEKRKLEPPELVFQSFIGQIKNKWVEWSNEADEAKKSGDMKSFKELQAKLGVLKMISVYYNSSHKNHIGPLPKELSDTYQDLMTNHFSKR